MTYMLINIQDDQYTQDCYDTPYIISNNHEHIQSKRVIPYRDVQLYTIYIYTIIFL